MVIYNLNVRKEFKVYLPIMNLLSKHFKNNCEVVLHDLSILENSLVAMAGNITGRNLGAPITNFVSEILGEEGDNVEDQIGYINTTKTGKILKCSTMFIKEEKKVIGCLCVNYDISEFSFALRSLEDFCSSDQMRIGENVEYYAKNVEDFVEDIINKKLQDTKPVKYLGKEERLELISKLYKKGVFLVKGSVELISKELGLSKYTIYNYLDGVKKDELKKGNV